MELDAAQDVGSFNRRNQVGQGHFLANGTIQIVSGGY